MLSFSQTLFKFKELRISKPVYPYSAFYLLSLNGVKTFSLLSDSEAERRIGEADGI